MLVLASMGALLTLSIWSMHMQAFENIRMASIDTCSEHHSAVGKLDYDVDDASSSSLIRRVSHITLKPGKDHCNYQSSEDFKCLQKSQRKENVWTLGQRLGGGTFGVVYATRSHFGQVDESAGHLEKGALKMAAPNAYRPHRQENCESIRQEVENIGQVVTKLNSMREYLEGAMCHKYIMTVVDSKPCVFRGGQATAAKNAFVMGTMDGDLDAYKEWAAFQSDQEHCMGIIIRKVIEAIVCMHKAGWAHLDIKEGNVLLKWSSGACPTDVRLTDFGESGLIGTQKKGKDPAFLMNASYMPEQEFTHGDFPIDGKLDWCMYALMFNGYPDELVKGQWDDYWGGDCGRMGPERKTDIVLTVRSPDHKVTSATIGRGSVDHDPVPDNGDGRMAIIDELKDVINRLEIKMEETRVSPFQVRSEEEWALKQELELVVEKGDLVNLSSEQMDRARTIIRSFDEEGRSTPDDCIHFFKDVLLQKGKESGLAVGKLLGLDGAVRVRDQQANASLLCTSLSNTCLDGLEELQKDYCYLWRNGPEFTSECNTTAAQPELKEALSTIAGEDLQTTGGGVLGPLLWGGDGESKDLRGASKDGIVLKFIDFLKNVPGVEARNPWPRITGRIACDDGEIVQRVFDMVEEADGHAHSLLSTFHFEYNKKSLMDVWRFPLRDWMRGMKEAPDDCKVVSKTRLKIFNSFWMRPFFQSVCSTQFTECKAKQ